MDPTARKYRGIKVNLSIIENIPFKKILKKVKLLYNSSISLSFKYISCPLLLSLSPSDILIFINDSIIFSSSSLSSILSI